MTQARDLGDAANKANFLDNVSSDIQTQVTANATAASNASTAAANAVLPAGVIMPFGGNSAPPGYLACVGQLVARSSYVSLYAAIGTLWNTGGENSAAFRLPDLRGAFLRGTGLHGTQTKADGGAYGSSFRPSGSFENDQAQSHGHAIRLHSSGSGGISLGSLSAVTVKSGQVTTMEESSAGPSRDGDETRPFNAGILYCIKT